MSVRRAITSTRRCSRSPPAHGSSHRCHARSVMRKCSSTSCLRPIPKSCIDCDLRFRGCAKAAATQYTGCRVSKNNEWADTVSVLPGEVEVDDHGPGQAYLIVVRGNNVGETFPITV